jgi:hypothetical protein
MKQFFLIISVFVVHFSFAITDSSEAKLNLKIRVKTYCKPRIIGMSPNKIMSIGYDYEFGQTLKSSDKGMFDPKANTEFKDTTTFNNVRGWRLSLKAPIINKPKIIWQFGINYWSINYEKDHTTYLGTASNFGSELQRLTTAGIFTSIYKPLNAKAFVILQSSLDLNGDYTIGNMQSLRYLRYSGAAMYGRRVHDRKQWAIGVARGYNAGLANILPMLMFNYTTPNDKSGVEIMLPARAWYRYKLNKNNLFRTGCELEGASYHIGQISYLGSDVDLRRGQLRFKVEYQGQLYKSFWIALQTGYCKILNFNLDYIKSDGKDQSRQFERDEPFYVMINKLSDFMFLNLSINFVSF